MKEIKTLTIMILIAIILAGCLDTSVIADPTPTRRTAPPAASTPLPANGEQAPRTPIIENPAGAVFEIPEYWQWAARPAATPQPNAAQNSGRGRSNYQ